MTIKSNSKSIRIASGQRKIDFSPGLNFLVGSNGSGKSTIFDLLQSGDNGVAKGEFEVEAEGVFDLRSVRMEGQRTPSQEKLAMGRDVACFHLLSQFHSHGEANWPVLKAMSDFEDGTLMLLDEPEQALDLEKVLKLRSLLKKNAKRLQFVIATHHPLLISMKEANVISVDKDPDYAEKVMAQYRKLLKA